MAKPLGYGKLKVNSCQIAGNPEVQENELMAYFEKQMNSFLGKNWIESDAITELFSMGFPNHGVTNNELSYMKLEMKGPNEFADAKSGKDFFKPFSKISKQTPIINSIYKNHKEKIDAIEIELKKAKEAELAMMKEEELKELALIEEKRKQEEENARLEKINSLLNEGPIFVNDTPDFDRTKGRMDNWLKQTKSDLLPEIFHNLLLTNLIRFYNDPKNRDKKNWDKPFDKNHIWKKIVSWVGLEVAEKWYSQIIK
jgi:hypothetical protein